MPRRMQVLAGVLVVMAGFGLPQAVHGQDECPEGMVRASPIGISMYLETSISNETEVANKVAVSAEKRMAPEAEVTGAPSTSTGSTSLVSSPAFTEALKVAWENGLVSSSDGVLTIDLNLFAFKSASNRWVEMDQAFYDTPVNRRLRRLGGAVSFGGEGEKFDRDGDGEADEPLHAKELGDIVTYELRYRVFGSRDRRERSNVQKYFRSPATTAFRDAYQRTIPPRVLDISEALDGSPLVEDGCVPKEEIDRLFEPYRAEASREIQDTRGAIDALLRSIDQSPILTLVVGGVDRETDFGTDERYAALRFAWASLEAELLYKEKDAFMAADPDPTTLNLGAKYSWYVMEGVLGPAKTLVSLEGSYEHFEDVPDTMHDTVSKVGLKTEYELSETMKIPLSVTWANHEDLLSDKDEIRGHIGLSFDVGNLLGKE